MIKHAFLERTNSGLMCTSGSPRHSQGSAELAHSGHKLLTLDSLSFSKMDERKSVVVALESAVITVLNEISKVVFIAVGRRSGAAGSWRLRSFGR